MTLYLFAICLVCSSLLAGVYALTKAPIDKAAAEKNEAAIKEVLPESAVIIEQEATVEMGEVAYTFNRAKDKDSVVVGYAINVSALGFGGPIVMKVGIDTAGVVCNTKVLSQAETPGLGAKCVEPAFAGQFKGFDARKNKLSVKKDGGDIDAITASTITSRAYVNGIQTAVSVFGTIMQTQTTPDTYTGASTNASEE